MLPVYFTPSAEQEVLEAADWYEERGPELRTGFLDQLDVAVSVISSVPCAYPVIYREVRRALLRRFPYALFYLTGTERVVVLAVLHQASDPARWPQAGD
jgi:toxin ParE1/3/4